MRLQVTLWARANENNDCHYMYELITSEAPPELAVTRSLQMAIDIELVTYAVTLRKE
jgi:hypothetical protein